MSTVLQQNRGSGVGEDTDMGDLTREEAESERPLAEDPLVRETGDEPVGDLTQVHNTLRNELSAFLSREA
jgi:hypothetical protein